MRNGLQDATAVILSTSRNGDTFTDGDELFPLPLELVVVDHEVIRALLAQPEGEPRNQFALDALKIGVLALRHTNGQATADLVQREVRGMQHALEQHVQHVNLQLAGTLKEYFDPANGRFSERVKGLVADDGELARLIRSHVEGDNSHLARTLLAHVGASSPLMKQLDPKQSEGLLSMIQQMVEGQLTMHGKRVIDEFSLDNRNGALARLVGELTAKHGDLTKTVGERIDDVIKEFSLDKPDSALSRLVQNVDRAQRTITNEFSLDSDTSCLSRLKRELFTVLEAHVKANADFQEEVKGALRELKARREEIARSPHHGAIFEDAVCELLVREAQYRGDTATPSGNCKGLKNKIGDCVIELGPDSAAPGARIVVEAKEEDKYTLQRAIAESDEARKNRDADWGIFVFSRKTAPSGLDSFQRRGNDFFIIWDAEDPLTDVFLKAAYEAARALCFYARRQSAASQVDFDAIDKAIMEIECRSRNLDEIRKSAETIQSSSTKILDRVRIDRDAFEKQVAILREKSADLKQQLNRHS
jgi:hypothetical protein